MEMFVFDVFPLAQKVVGYLVRDLRHMHCDYHSETSHGVLRSDLSY